jgi:hypothetical protein
MEMKLDGWILVGWVVGCLIEATRYLITDMSQTTNQNQNKNTHSCAQTAMHPANVVKTLLQTKGSNELQNLNFRILTRGAGAQFVLSLPHGALAFAVLEVGELGERLL